MLIRPGWLPDSMRSSIARRRFFSSSSRSMSDFSFSAASILAFMSATCADGGAGDERESEKRDNECGFSRRTLDRLPQCTPLFRENSSQVRRWALTTTTTLSRSGSSTTFTTSARARAKRTTRRCTSSTRALPIETRPSRCGRGTPFQSTLQRTCSSTSARSGARRIDGWSLGLRGQERGVISTRWRHRRGIRCCLGESGK